AQHAEDASRLAAQTARDYLLQSGREGQPPEAAMLAAIHAANEAVRGLPCLPDSAKDPPATTIVAALVLAGVATIGWVGDSRAYWFAPEGVGVITHDHSWVNDVVEAGEMTEEEALHAPEAHAITRCLGAFRAEDSDISAEPSMTTFPLPAGVRLLLCSD